MGYVRLKDIADKADVSVNTVSRSLKDKSDIGAATKKRIKKIAEMMGYIPDTRASRLRSNNNKTVGVVVTYLDNFFYNRILIGISEALTGSGYTPIIFSNSEDINSEEGILKTLAANRVAGALIVPASDLINRIDYKRYNFPCITIVRRKIESRLSYFINDSEKGGELVGNLFAVEGRKNPAYLGVNLPISCNRDRVKGYALALEKAGVKLLEKRIICSGLSLHLAYEQTKEFFTRDKKIDSLFVYNDNLAFAALRALNDLGIKSPDDVRIVGYDDVEESQYSIPALSTIKVPRYRLGFESASSLLQLIEDGNTKCKNMIYQPTLIVRET